MGIENKFNNVQGMLDELQLVDFNNPEVWEIVQELEFPRDSDQIISMYNIYCTPHNQYENAKETRKDRKYKK